MNIINVTDATFAQEVISSDKPVLVDFWAPWCGPCKQLAPVLDEVANERADVQIVKIDVDANPETAKKLGVRGVPTLILFQRGEQIAARTGALRKAQVLALIDTAD